MKNHGFVCVGKSMREAHDDIVNINNMVKFNF